MVQNKVINKRNQINQQQLVVAETVPPVAKVTDPIAAAFIESKLKGCELSSVLL